MEAAKQEGFPTDVEDKEAYFMSEVARGETLCQDGMFVLLYVLPQHVGAEGFRSVLFRVDGSLC